MVSSRAAVLAGLKDIRATGMTKRSEIHRTKTVRWGRVPRYADFAPLEARGKQNDGVWKR